MRAAAVSSLAKFAAKCPSLRASIMTLLKRSLNDEDDETRDRTTVAVCILEDAMEEFPYEPAPEDEEPENAPVDKPADGDSAAFLLLDTLPMSFDKLQRSLKVYQSSPGSMESAVPITLTTLPVVEDSTEEDVVMSNDPLDNGILSAPSIDAVQEKVDPAAVIYAIPEFAEYGRVFRSSAPVALTESETEYVVSCVKHVFEDHIILQFSIQNTIDDQRLENVTVMLESDGDVFEVQGEMQAENIKYGDIGNCYSVLGRNMDFELETTAFNCTLSFNVIQVDPASGEDEGDAFEEEYPLEDLEVSTADYMAKVTVPDFRKSWESVGNANEVLEKYALQFKSLDDAVIAVVTLLGMQPCDGTGSVKASTAGKPHMLHLSGVFIGGISVLARAQLAMQNESSGVVLKIAVRSEDENVPRMVADCIR